MSPLQALLQASQEACHYFVNDNVVRRAIEIEQSAHLATVPRAHPTPADAISSWPSVGTLSEPIAQPGSSQPADGVRDGDGVWRKGKWHPDKPAAQPGLTDEQLGEIRKRLKNGVSAYDDEVTALYEDAVGLLAEIERLRNLLESPTQASCDDQE